MLSFRDLNYKNSPIFQNNVSFVTVLISTITSIMTNQSLPPIVASALNLVNQQLLSFTTDTQFNEKLTLAFGDAINAESYQQLWTNSNFKIEPVIEIRSQNELKGANGAFSTDTNKIYLAEEYLATNSNNLQLIGALILEEYGHYIDTVINGDNDSDGDEGAIFSALVMGETLDNETLQALKTEDDTATIIIDGQLITLEMQDFTGDDGNNLINGTSGNDFIQGLGGNDTLNGLGGSDAIVGGLGNDIIDGGGDTNGLYGEDGNDYLKGGVGDDYGYYLNFYNAYGGLYGGNGNDTLDGGGGDDYLDPGMGIDSIIGGAGSDGLVINYSGQNTALIVKPSGQNTSSQTNYQGIERAAMVGSSNNDIIDGSGVTGINGLYGEDGNDYLKGGVGDDYGYYLNFYNAYGGLYGGNGNDTLDGGGGDDYLDPGMGIDSIIGGAGSDGLVINYSGQNTALIVKPSGQNTSNQTNYQGIENAVMLGSNNNDTIDGSGVTNINGLYGENGNDYLKGGIGDDNTNYLGFYNGYGGLYGGNGNDTLDGGAGNDYVEGGSGIDTLIINYSSITTDGITYTNNGDGSFTFNAVSSSVRYTSIEIFNLTGTTKNDDLRGGNLNDTLNGGAGNDTLIANSGNDILNGGSGIDSLVGGAGDDTYTIDSLDDVIIEASNAGTDTVQSSLTYTLATNLENLTLIGTGNINGTGNGDDNVITGNSGNNILSGGGGNDTLIGGVGNDTYTVESVNIVVTESANQGTDLVNSSITYTLTDNVENLTLTGTGNINGTGNTLNNNIIGNDGNNTLTGNDGNDNLNGGIGNDSLIGGNGNDVYIVDNSGDRITEALNQGTELVNSSVTYTLAVNVENLTLTGTGNINGTGNSLNNVITGNNGNNVLNGGVGADTLIGGNGNDTYTVDNVGDVIQETSTITTEIDTVQSFITYTLGANLEKLTLIGTNAINGIGNTLNNTITGNTANNILSGSSGNDTLNGGSGNDTVNGGSGADSLIGGIGDDFYSVDNIGDRISENVDEGNDTVQSTITYTLGENLENLILTGNSNINGTGNTINNNIFGNDGNNSLVGADGNDYVDGGVGNDSLNGGNGDDYIYDAGYGIGQNNLSGGDGNDTLIAGDSNDTVDGGIGNDSLVGGNGNELYIVDNTDDRITEALNEGTDLVNSSITYTLGINLENLTLTGIGNISGTGNTLNNRITGNSGNNILNGGNGNDILIGGNGNDTYTVDDVGDVITEALNAGTDSVNTSITYTLAVNLENLTLTGTTAINGTGNTFANIMTGNTANNRLDGLDGNDTLSGDVGNDTLIGSAGNDTLIGGSGDDTLTGGTGNDFFRFNSTSEKLDRITDFSVLDDTIQVGKSGFDNNLVLGTLATTQFTIGSSATTIDHRFIYNSTTGALLFDVDGSGASASMQIATLNTGLLLTNADIVVV